MKSYGEGNNTILNMFLQVEEKDKSSMGDYNIISAEVFLGKAEDGKFYLCGKMLIKEYINYIEVESHEEKHLQELTEEMFSSYIIDFIGEYSLGLINSFFYDSSDESTSIDNFDDTKLTISGTNTIGWSKRSPKKLNIYTIKVIEQDTTDEDRDKGTYEYTIENGLIKSLTAKYQKTVDGVLQEPYLEGKTTLTYKNIPLTMVDISLYEENE